MVLLYIHYKKGKEFTVSKKKKVMYLSKIQKSSYHEVFLFLEKQFAICLYITSIAKQLEALHILQSVAKLFANLL